MNTSDSSSNDALRLKRLLKAAALKSYRLDPTHRMVNFIGRAREWALVVGLTADWLNVTTILCELPNETGMRARLLEWAMQTNRTIVLAKFGVFGQNLELEIDYRAEHVDDAVLGHLVSLLFNLAEEHYPKVFRIVNGDDVLESLERALEPGASA